MVNWSSRQVLTSTTDFDEVDSADTATVTVNYTMSDNEGAAASAVAAITVNGVNDTPVANDDTATTDENTGVNVDVLANDTDVDGDDDSTNFSLDSIDSITLSGLSISTLATGSVTIVGGELVFAPGTDFDELDSTDTATVTVNYTMSDNEGAAASAVATITVNGVNDTPVANDDMATTGENTGVTVDVLANDTDVDGDDDSTNFSLDSIDSITLSGLSISTLATGSVTIVGGELVFAPGTDFDELDSTDTATVTVNYTMSDNEKAAASAVATITVNGVNDAPVANDDMATTDENTGVTVDVPTIANDTDVDGDDDSTNFSLDSIDSITLSGLSISTLATGSVTIVGGELVFAPGTDFDELDSTDTATVTVNYTMSDDEGATASAVATIAVNGVNDAPVANDDMATTDENTGVTVDVLANDTDVDGDDDSTNFSLDSIDSITLSGLSISTLATGSVTIVGGELVFAPGTDFDELDSTDTATVTVNYTIE